MENFMEILGREIEGSETILTENGAVAYKNASTNLLNMEFRVSSYRDLDKNIIIEDFIKSYNESPTLAMRWLFHARDVREGLGERNLFRVVMSHLCTEHEDLVIALIPLIPEYGRYDDILPMLGISGRVDMAILNFIRITLIQDMDHMSNGEPVTLLAKWLPSAKATSKESRELSAFIRRNLSISKVVYSSMLKSLRRYIDVVEVKMSTNKWEEIEYSKVPSKANLIYRNAFMRHDRCRREEYLEDLKNGTTKINSKALYPYEIVSKYLDMNEPKEDTLEEMWRSLPSPKELSEQSTICVQDGSGSMNDTIGRTNSSALSVAMSLAIYFSERCNSVYKDKFITFSERPRFVDLSGKTGLFDKVKYASEFCEIANTDIEKVFRLILDIAIKNNVPDSDLPKNILILSDMEFDSATGNYFGNSYSTLFDNIRDMFNRNGYTLPKLIFWNIMSSTMGVPIKTNKSGVSLVSGFSTNTFRMVMSNKCDPMEILVDELMRDRYDEIEEAISELV